MGRRDFTRDALAPEGASGGSSGVSPLVAERLGYRLTMSNPALELIDLYSSWRDKANGTATMADIIDPMNVDRDDIIAAMRLLTRIDGILVDHMAAGRRVGVYRRQFPGWCGPVIAWNSSGWMAGIKKDQIVSSTLLDQIESFSNYLDGKVLEVFRIEDDLRSVLDQARTLLEADASLDPALRHFVHRLLQSIQNALDDDSMRGAFDFDGAIANLFLALRAAEGASKEPARWKNIIDSLMTGVATGLMVEGTLVTLRALNG